MTGLLNLKGFYGSSWRTNPSSNEQQQGALTYLRILAAAVPALSRDPASNPRHGVAALDRSEE